METQVFQLSWQMLYPPSQLLSPQIRCLNHSNQICINVKKSAKYMLWWLGSKWTGKQTKNSWRERSREKKSRMCLGWGEWSRKNIALKVLMSSLRGRPETHPCLNKRECNDSTTVSTRAVHHGRTSLWLVIWEGLRELDFSQTGCSGDWGGNDSIICLNKSSPEGFAWWNSSDTHQPGLKSGH